MVNLTSRVLVDCTTRVCEGNVKRLNISSQPSHSWFRLRCPSDAIRCQTGFLCSLSDRDSILNDGSRQTRVNAGADVDIGSGGDGELGSPPWEFGFQCNERYLDWDLSAQRQLLRIVAAEKLGISADDLNQRIDQVGTLVPDLVGKLEIIKADLLVKLLEDTRALSEKLVVLREALPEANVSGLVTMYPYLVADNSADEIKTRIERMREMLPGVDVAELLFKEPRLFEADLQLVLEEIKRLMGDNVDPVALLVAQPEMVLSMEQTGLTSAIDLQDPNIS